MGVRQNSNKMRTVIIIGIPGCLKCSKMEIILKNREINTELIYINSREKQKIEGIDINVDEKTHFPLFIYNKKLYDSFSILNKELRYYTRNEC